MSKFPESKATLIEELEAARRDTRLKARFLSYRMNCPTQDETRILLSVDEYQRVLDREVPPRHGRPVGAVDLGAGRAWSAGCLVWKNGRTEAFAVAPGTPSIEHQERRDGVPTGTYHRLVADGVLTTDGDLRVPRVKVLVDRILTARPRTITCDRFRLSELQDAVGGRCRVEPRGQRWSEGIGGYSGRCGGWRSMARCLWRRGPVTLSLPLSLRRKSRVTIKALCVSSSRAQHEQRPR